MTVAAVLYEEKYSGIWLRVLQIANTIIMKPEDNVVAAS